jgi:hypothetical protein
MICVSTFSPLTVPSRVNTLTPLAEEVYNTQSTKQAPNQPI